MAQNATIPMTIHGTKEAYYQCRLFAELHLHLQVKAFCDNMQTLNLILKAAKALNSRLKHTDVHNHWLRHEAAKKKVDILYVPSNEQEADGLTKPLPAAKHAVLLSSSW